MPQFWVFQRRMASSSWIRTPASLQWEGCLVNFRRIGRSLLRTLAGVFGCLSGGIARRAERCWRWSLCALTSRRTYVVLSSLCARITAHFGGCRNFGTVTVCWPAGTCCWASFQLHSNTGRGPSNTDGLSRQCGQCSRPNCPVLAPDALADDMDCPTSLLDQPFEFSEMGDYMDADLLPELSRETWVTATLLAEPTADLPLTDEEQDLIAASQCDETLTTVRFDYRQSYVAGDCRSGICPSTRKNGCGVVGLPRRRPRS